MTEYKNILIIQTAFIGDAILASSLIEKMHHCFPNSSISIIVRKGNESIYDSHPFLKETLIWNKSENKISNLLKLILDVRKKKFDCIINCHRFASSGLIASFSGAAHITGYKQNPFSFSFNTTVKHDVQNRLHEIERYNQLVEDFTDHKIFKPKLYPTKENFEKVKSLAEREYYCIAPASVWFTKQLPQKKWIELCNKLPKEKKIFLLGSKDDEKLCQEISEKSSHKNISVLAGTLALLESCALMKNAKMNFVNDSAPLHLASSVNAPVTAFFLSTNPAFGFGPLSDDKKIIEVSGLSCRPCGLHGHKSCPQKHFDCAEKIEINSI